MIERYDIPEISSIWNLENKFKSYLEVELALYEAQGHNPEQIRGKVKINVERIKELEQITQHDVIAFCTSITEQLPTEVGRWLHFGATSSDIIDTATTLQMKSSLEIVLRDLSKFLHTLWMRSVEFKEFPTMGRSHGMYAEPMSLGQKWLGFYAEFYRHYENYKQIIHHELTGKFSGAVGNYTILSPELEEKALKILHLQSEPVSTQIIPRDRWAKWILQGALLGSSIERMATEIRHLHRSEVAEVCEAKGKNQKGSSTMPHKKNPISCENLTGIARILRSHSMIALENVPLWHERDISHSSAERIFFPDHFGLLSYSLRRMNSTFEQLIINKDIMEKRLKDNPQIFSSLQLHQLLESRPNESRENLYTSVQQNTGEIKIVEDAYLKHTQKVFDRVAILYPLPTMESRNEI